MRNYEAMYILKPELEEEALNAAIARFEEVVTNNGGEVVKTDRWGKRRLAYEVKGYLEGFYVLMEFKAPNNLSQELDRIFKIQDDVIRHLVIKKDE
ncbi:MAG TPA: 30S ribosomal protein S6 [Bacillota bacterium]|nr:30S ribosomal protein S6 [Bacillota bacterium]HPT86697.1 30S ribosomal protein S6 [Bacillota bacterium]